jgi:hypothetical protein
LADEVESRPTPWEDDGMLRLTLAALALTGLASVASAAEVLIPNGGFEDDGATPPGGFTQTISNWTVTFVGAPSSNQYSGLFNSYGLYVAPQGSTFALLNNLGEGTAVLTSSVFALTDRQVQFRYVYLTNDPPDSATQDGFTVVIEFFADAAGTMPIGLLTMNPNTTPVAPTDVGSPPFDTAPVTYGGPLTPNDFALMNINVESFFGNFARISFAIDNNGPGPGTENGNGVSGILLDDVLLTPEPGTLALFGLGALGLGGVAWRRRRRRAPAPAQV